MKKTLGILFASIVAVVALAIPTLGAGAGQSVRVTEVDGRIALSARPKAGLVNSSSRTVAARRTTSGFAAAASAGRRMP